jgi:hypothetical protein
MNEQRKIKEDLNKLDERLVAAEDYVSRNVNIESSSLFHSEDWNGKSGHPLWMKNHMIPTTKKICTKMEQALESINKKNKGKHLKQRKNPLKHI